ncbi:MAG TPA: deoxyribodipyrimidine photo-lyase [Blastocatellia bacterium]|nr:deoxyribodipyrimidine photo-lyase [Blastocatellia bacterium]
MMLERLLTDPRITVRRSGTPEPDGRCVVYWMQRAQRGLDNPALDVAIAAANELRQPVAVFFGLHPGYPHGNLRHYTFLADGLKETAERIEARGAAFIFRPYPQHNLIRFCAEVKPSLVIGDENPLREPAGWRQSATAKLRVPFWTVDADVIVPTKFFPKEEYAARTLRPQLHKLLPAFLRPLTNPQAGVRWPAAQRPVSEPIDPAQVLARLPLDRSVQPVSDYPGGTAEALRRLQRFTRERLTSYDADRNLPPLDGTSELSAHLHFGHISPLTIALAVKEADAPQTAKDVYLEELIVRRELAINFVARNQHYDSLQCAEPWALRTLAEERCTEREYLYTEAQLEQAATHDELWNAAQMEMVITGRMHGYMRMYWAKKILEWTRTPEEAFEIAVQLNDRYELDGRDPNGYAGIAWAIAGKHDRAWGPKRPVFGLIRYMNAAGCARKFDVKAYIASVRALTS